MEGTGITFKKMAGRGALCLSLHVVLGKVLEQRVREGRAILQQCWVLAQPLPIPHIPWRALQVAIHPFIFPLQGTERGLVKDQM